ncbi:UPF0182 family protein [Nodosilinea sp. LEGE 07088]|uniref:UPF0182 family membrane protein n=1 Tax=Nodosilinea sp. LEGE 07088 TaxID=2777968 RepID=UPI00188012E0|nr:UPF0182 family protein [Nodosilinea sp. LEGE 07088]MBE9140073.1 UPF0182 family protein [Nodosilinea sp. LEGE 07088]
MTYSSTKSLRARRLLPWLVAITLLLVFSGGLVHLLTESWWFESVGYGSVFWLRLKWQLALGLGGFVLYGGGLWASYQMALRLTRDRTYRFLSRYSDQTQRDQLERLLNLGALGLIFVLALGVALRAASAWQAVLQFLNPTVFGTNDPIFGRDIGFYVFKLPLWQGLQDTLLGLLVWSLLIAATVYALKGEVRPERGWKYFLTGEAKAHLCLLLAAIAVLLAAGFWLDRYSLLYADGGVIFGAGYTDVHARLQAYWLMGFVTLAVAALFVIALGRSGFSLPIFGIVIYLGLLVLVNGLYPWFQQNFVVEPNELTIERPYIEHNIAFTREAYNLTSVTSEPFPAENNLTRSTIEANGPTVGNIRLWDYAPLLSTYKQLQEIRLYYNFEDVDIDRYTLNGDYRQVALSARELPVEQLPSEAQNWINRQLKFTHGFGVVMSPVNQVTPNGLPEFFIRNVPPNSTVDLPLDQPRIYYGESTRNYIFTGANTDEFDYPLGDTNAAYRYTGAGGVRLNSFLRRLVYAYDLGNLRVLISNYFNNETRIHYHRLITDRVRQVTPFLTFDSDPYPAIIDGRIKWILDGYTSSDRYPYSEPLNRRTDLVSLVDSTNPLMRNGVNYIRDAVKVFIDAYDGTLEFYARDRDDPLLATYSRIFPNVFQPIEAMPAAYREHLRYPEDIFTVQAQMYRAYHMENPEVFYNREDLWRFPEQTKDDVAETMEPYYIIMKLPKLGQEEFLQILPFTPANRDNMIAWMAGGSDGDNYGRLLLYEFPKQELVFGPTQIEARISQTPEISEQLTLWNQQGSGVIRGTLLVVPVEQSLLYVQPIYLRSDQGELPELRRVIVAYNDQVVMRETLDQSLEVIFGAASASPPTPTPEGTDVAAPANTVAALVQAALQAYQDGQQALQQGDWQRYGTAQQQLEGILQELNQQNP